MSNTTALLIIVLASLGLVLNGYAFIRNALPEHRARQESRLRADGYAPPWWMGWAYWFGLDTIILRSKMKPNCLLCEHPESLHASRNSYGDRTCGEPSCRCLSGLFLLEKMP